MALTNDELQKLAAAQSAAMNNYRPPGSNQARNQALPIAASQLVRSYLSPERWGGLDDGMNQVLYIHTPHAPAAITKTLVSFGWQRHVNNVGSDSPELFTHKDHEGACLFWYEAMAVQMSLAFVELNK